MDRFEQLTNEILKVNGEIKEINGEIKGLIQKEMNAKDEELLSILKDDMTRLVAKEKQLLKERENLHCPTGK